MGMMGLIEVVSHILSYTRLVGIPSPRSSIARPAPRQAYQTTMSGSDETEVARWMTEAEERDPEGEEDPTGLRDHALRVVMEVTHNVAGEAAKIGQPVAVLGRDDETELMPVLSPALQKRAAINRVGLRSIEPASFSFPAHPVALQIT